MDRATLNDSGTVFALYLFSHAQEWLNCLVARLGSQSFSPSSLSDYSLTHFDVSCICSSWSGELPSIPNTAAYSAFFAAAAFDILQEAQAPTKIFKSCGDGKFFFYYLVKQLAS